MLRNRSCEITNVGKSRNGKPRFWCVSHGANATGRYGARLDECEGAYLSFDDDECFVLSENDYPGGIGIWGAVAPIFNTAAVDEPSGIHVHARTDVGEDRKTIDATYPAVKISHKRDLLDDMTTVITQVKWSGKFGQHAKMYPAGMNGYENDEAT